MDVLLAFLIFASASIVLGLLLAAPFVALAGLCYAVVTGVRAGRRHDAALARVGVPRPYGRGYPLGRFLRDLRLVRWSLRGW